MGTGSGYVTVARVLRAGCPVEEAIREEVRLTVLHEFGHYFGLDEKALEGI